MKLSSTVAYACVVVYLTASQALAAGPDFTPGKWTFESTTLMSMMGAPRTETETRCVTPEEAEADPLAAMVEEDRCTVLSRSETGDSIAFEVECAGDPTMNMKMRGTGELTADGATASGSMDMVMDMPSMPGMPQQMDGEMTMNLTWTGTRLGDCD